MDGARFLPSLLGVMHATVDLQVSMMRALTAAVDVAGGIEVYQSSKCQTSNGLGETSTQESRRRRMVAALCG